MTLRRSLIPAALLFLTLLTSAPLIAAPQRPLDIYFIDVEGGAATLMVTPLGESILVDSGWSGFEDRDARRIHQVATQVAGLKRIDHAVTTHWHMDHYGALGRLAEMIPVLNYYDRGIPDALPEDPENFPKLIADYKRASRGHSRTLRAGDDIDLIEDPDPGPRLRLRCLTASGQVIGESKPSTAPSGCSRHPSKPEDTSDNAKSISLLLTYGRFGFLNCGDLTWNVEHRLVCPKNRVGSVDLFQVTHHGMDISNNPAVIEAIRPRVAVTCNGPRKGGSPATYANLRRTAGVEAIYQLHRNVATSAAENTAPERIANMEAECTGQWIKVSVAPDAKSYTVQIGPEGAKRQFKVR
jgi:beta-lactamase superfamily II metal-dependent hydrolase